MNIVCNFRKIIENYTFPHTYSTESRIVFSKSSRKRNVPKRQTNARSDSKGKVIEIRFTSHVDNNLFPLERITTLTRFEK